MTRYRLYFMSSRNGHIERVEDLLVGDDHEAIAAAKTLVADQPIELWCEHRKVHRFETPATALLERYVAHRARAAHRNDSDVVQLSLVHARAG